MRTARDITFNEAELVGNINIEHFLKIIIFTITTIIDDSDLIISETVKMTI